jgi:ribosomal protein L11 methyltransferase
LIAGNLFQFITVLILYEGPTMPFYELTLPVTSSQAKPLEAIIADLGAVAITFQDDSNVPIYEPLPGETPLWDFLKLTALFEDQQSLNRARTFLKSHLPQVEIIATQLQDEIWERMWMDHFKPMKFGTKSWIIPHGYELVDTEAVNLYLDPGLAFGTGTHATTALCLEWLDQHDVTGQHWVDFGCGSGILAIMALLQGAERVICVDIDAQAIEATLQNAEKNNVVAGIEIVAPDAIAGIRRMDGILANILAAPLKQLRTSFVPMLKPGGRIVLSGILSEQYKALRDEYAQSFIDIDCQNLDDWVRVSARLP